MSDALISAANEVRAKVSKLVREILEDPRMSDLRKLLAGLNTLEDLCGQPKTAMAALFNFGSDAEIDVSIEPHEFYGKKPLDAAKRYLKKLGDVGRKSARFQDIVAAIRKGGCDLENEEKLKVSLARSTWDVGKIGDENFGLLEFFPDVKRGKKGGRPRTTSEAREMAEEMAAENQQGDAMLNNEAEVANSGSKS